MVGQESRRQSAAICNVRTYRPIAFRAERRNMSLDASAPQRMIDGARPVGARCRIRSQMTPWAFDLLYLNGKDLRPLPLLDRKERPERLASKVRDPWLSSADRMGLEGIVSKKAAMPYRSGSKCDWIKVKCPSWREANRQR